MVLETCISQQTSDFLQRVLERTRVTRIKIFSVDSNYYWFQIIFNQTIFRISSRFREEQNEASVDLTLSEIWIFSRSYILTPPWILILSIFKTIYDPECEFNSRAFHIYDYVRLIFEASGTRVSPVNRGPNTNTLHGPFML